MGKEISKNKHDLDLSRLIYPLFIKEAGGLPMAVEAMPGIYKYSLESLNDLFFSLDDFGLRNILIFGIPLEKTKIGQKAWVENNFIAQAITFIKSYYPQITIFSDVCLCAYTQHGHCGIIQHGKTEIDKKATLVALANMALSQAKAGADYVCPSAMMPNQVQAIRSKLDRAGYSHTKIMAYSAKFASQFYGPFRQVADSAPRFGDRRGYQLDFSEKETAIFRVEQDIKEGADIVMVKPALAYLDLAVQIKEKFNFPLAVYNVSGEYAIAKLGSQKGLWPEKDFVYEILSGFNRAGADYIISYHTADIARWQKSYQKKELDYAEPRII